MQGWLKGQSHILKIAIMVPRKRLSRAIAATFRPRGRRALRACRPRGLNIKNRIIMQHFVLKQTDFEVPSENDINFVSTPIRIHIFSSCRHGNVSGVCRLLLLILKWQKQIHIRSLPSVYLPLILMTRPGNSIWLMTAMCIYFEG